MFCAALADLSEKRLQFGFGQVLKFWKPEFGKKFPAPAEIRDFAMQYVAVDPIAETRRIYLDRAEKPADWEPITDEDRAELQQKLADAMNARAMPSYTDNAARLARERLDTYPYVPSDDPEEERRRQKHIREYRARKGMPELNMPPIPRQPGEE